MQVKLLAHIFLQGTDSDTPIAVRVNARALQELAQKSAALVTPEDILFAPKFTVTFNNSRLCGLQCNLDFGDQKIMITLQSDTT